MKTALSLTFLAAMILLLFLSGSLLPAAPPETRLMRFPDIWHDQVVFVYAEDLWVASTQGGAARRLTSHPGDELFPKFSPDGKWIAFTGQYGGNSDVYVVPVAGLHFARFGFAGKQNVQRGRFACQLQSRANEECPGRSVPSE